MRKTIKKMMPNFLINWYLSCRMKKNSLLYRGDKVVCPICNSKFREFRPDGLTKNVICHKCGSFERHRLLWMYLNEKSDLFNVNNKIRLLHFAPEKVFYDAFSTYQNIEYYPCDFTPETYAHYAKKVKIEKIDITDISFEENYFDIIICSHVLEHISDDTLAMSELYRVLKKGGWSILQVPIDYNRETTYEDFSITTAKGRKKAFGQDDHVRIYGRDYKDRLKKVGFVVNVDDFIKSFSQEDLVKYGLLSSHLIYNCKK